MAIEISQETRDTTTKCHKDFSCLTGQSACLCRVVNCVDDVIHFVQDPAGSGCPYLEQWGLSTQYCSCPTRMAIYNRYGV